MVGLAFTIAEPYPGELRIMNMMKPCCVHNGGRAWFDFSGPLVGGVPCGEGSESKIGGTTGFCCRNNIPNDVPIPRINIQNDVPIPRNNINDFSRKPAVKLG